MILPRKGRLDGGKPVNPSRITMQRGPGEKAGGCPKWERNFADPD
jgi:hypothetical protein